MIENLEDHFDPITLSKGESTFTILPECHYYDTEDFLKYEKTYSSLRKKMKIVFFEGVNLRPSKDSLSFMERRFAAFFYIALIISRFKYLRKNYRLTKDAVEPTEVDRTTYKNVDCGPKEIYKMFFKNIWIKIMFFITLPWCMAICGHIDSCSEDSHHKPLKHSALMFWGVAGIVIALFGIILTAHCRALFLVLYSISMYSTISYILAQVVLTKITDMDDELIVGRNIIMKAKSCAFMDVAGKGNYMLRVGSAHTEHLIEIFCKDGWVWEQSVGLCQNKKELVY